MFADIVQARFYGDCSEHIKMKMVDGTPMIPTQYEKEDVKLFVQYTYGARVGKFAVACSNVQL